MSCGTLWPLAASASYTPNGEYQPSTALSQDMLHTFRQNTPRYLFDDVYPAPLATPYIVRPPRPSHPLTALFTTFFSGLLRQN